MPRGGEARSPDPAPVPVWWTWAALGLLFVVANGAEALLALAGRQLEAGGVLLLNLAGLFLSWQWLETQCRPYRQRWPLDMGLFLWGAAFAVIPYFLWRHQRWRGLRKLALLGAMWIASWLLARGAAFVLFVLAGGRL